MLPESRLPAPSSSWVLGQDGCFARQGDPPRPSPAAPTLPSHLLAEAARVVRPSGRIAFVHTLVPMPPPGCRVVKVLGLSTGFGFHMRAVTIYEREQARLL